LTCNRVSCSLPSFELNVEYVPLEDELWSDLWQLHRLQGLAVVDKQKLFESDIVSLPMDGVG
jgi:hypothetical protein